jgi:hypothetical protein
VGRIVNFAGRNGRALKRSAAACDQLNPDHLPTLSGPGLPDVFKYLVMAGAATGGGLTVIANSPNPAAQSILAWRFAEAGISLRTFSSEHSYRR